MLKNYIYKLHAYEDPVRDRLLVLWSAFIICIQICLKNVIYAHSCSYTSILVQTSESLPEKTCLDVQKIGNYYLA